MTSTGSHCDATIRRPDDPPRSHCHPAAAETIFKAAHTPSVCLCRTFLANRFLFLCNDVVSVRRTSSRVRHCYVICAQFALLGLLLCFLINSARISHACYVKKRKTAARSSLVRSVARDSNFF